VFTQQRHKVCLKEINEYQVEESKDEIECAKNGIITQVFS